MLSDDEIKLRKKKYRRKNKEKISKYNKEYYSENKEVILNNHSVWNSKNKGHVNNYNKEYYSKNKIEIDNLFKKYYRINIEYFREKAVNYRESKGIIHKNQKRDYDLSPVNQNKARERHRQNWRSYLISSAKAGAERRGIKFTITESDFLDPKGQKCPIFGTEFVLGNGKPVDASASLDRIDPSKGYVPGNIQVLSFLANRIKFNATPEIIRRIGESVLFMEQNLPYIVEDKSSDTEVRRKAMIRQRRFHRSHKDFSIIWYNISLPEFCPCLGVPFDYSGKKGEWMYWATIDRIDNTKGYIPGNVWVISSLANVIKTSATGEQILKVASFMEIQNMFENPSSL